MKKKLHLLCYLFVSCLPLVAQTPAPDWKVIESENPTDEVVVQTFNVVTDYKAKGDGTTNDTQAFQNALNRLGTLKGGVLYVPAGKYKITTKLNIPKGVSIRGEWKKPVKGQPIEGTILMAYYGAGRDMMDESYAFITMEPSTLVSNLSIWYPEQDPGNIKTYPPTILMGKPSYWGNDYCNVRNVTLVNSYNGVCSNKANGGGCHNVYGLYGTPLSIGVELDNLADVGRLEWIDFSPEYWAGSGLANSPALNSAYKDWIYNNGTGIMMRRNDWTYTCFVNIDGYKTGFSASPSRVQGNPNGHNYGVSLKNCKTAVYVDAVAESGIMFTRFNVDNCVNGVVVADGTPGIIHLNNWTINATSNAVLVNPNAATKVMMEQCLVNQGRVNMKGSVLLANNNDFNNGAPHITIGTNARANITGNRFSSGEPDIQNNSMFKNIIDHTPVAVAALPAFPERRAPVTKPAKTTNADLYVVTKAPYNAVANGTTDNTAAIQQALNDAGAAGGGLVYLPAGKYKVLGNLTVPTGVELRGAKDLSAVPEGPGAILEVYAGKDDNTAEPFLKLSERSGIRGVDFNYPEQLATLMPNMHEYPYCIQLMGKDIYVVNVGIRATMYGLDLFSYKCDNHYVEYLAGHVFKVGIKVGGGAENGVIYNTQFNNIVYAYGMQSKFGEFPNSPTDPSNNPLKQDCYDYGSDNQQFLILGNCKNETLYNDFHIGSQVGVTFGDASGVPSGISMGMAVDDSRRALRFVGLAPEGFDLINTQIVSTSTTKQDTKFIELDAAFTGKSTLFSSNYWGSAAYAVTAGGGEVELICANLRTSGSTRFLQLSGNPSVKVVNSYIAKKSIVNSGFASKVSIQSSLVDLVDVTAAQCALWKNNLPISPEFNSAGALSRTGWIASSFNSNAHNNAIDGNINSRWSNIGAQTAGQWFAVNTKTPVTFNKVILDSSPSGNDGPAGYALYLSNNGADWGDPVATGVGAGVTIISIPQTTAQYVKVEQTTTGVKSNYWSIHEFYLYQLEETGITAEATSPSQHRIYIAGGTLYTQGLTDEYPAQLSLYNLSGQKVLSETAVTQGVDISYLPKGIYIVEVRQNGKIYREKVIKK
ncbi:glycosyl hydrolase family 28-related protein [Viscerimonas tarda]